MSSPAFRIHRLDHVQLAMPRGEEAVARAFYTDLLGLTEIPKPANLTKRGGVWFGGGTLRLHLGVEAGFRPALRLWIQLMGAELGRFCDGNPTPRRKSSPMFQAPSRLRQSGCP